MANQSLKSKATSGFLWNAVDRVSLTIGRFVIGIILARLLVPEDFGLIGMLSIFIAISQVFVQSGMGSGLIQKPDRTDKDFSTVFIFNLVVSAVCYILLFVAAPHIASYFGKPILIPLVRVLGLTLIFNAIAVVQRTKLEIEVDFKTLAKVNIIALALSGILAILAALHHFGVWALVIQIVSISIFTTTGLWIVGNWTLSFSFSKKSFYRLFGYGSKLLAAGIYARCIQDVYNLVIGKVYTARQLGFFVQARKISEVSSGAIAEVLHKVTFPLLSSLQKDEERMIRVSRRMIKMAAFITVPVMTVLALLAKPIVLLLLTEKWLGVIPLFYWLCLSRIAYPINIINMNVLNAVGRSDLFLKADLAKFPIILIALIITIPISLKAVVIGMVVTSLANFFISAYLPGKLFGYGPFEQLKDMFPVIISSAIMGLGVYFIVSLVEELFYQLFIGLFVAGILYLLLTYLLKVEELGEFKKLILDKFVNRRR